MTTLLRRGCLTVKAKTRERKKAEPLPHNVRFSAEKSRFLACATTTTVQAQEGEFVQGYTSHCRFYHGDKRPRAEMGVAQGSDHSLTGLEL